MPENRVLSFLIFHISQFHISKYRIHFGKLTQRKKADGEICALRRLNGVLFTVAKLYISREKEERRHGKAWVENRNV